VRTAIAADAGLAASLESAGAEVMALSVPAREGGGPTSVLAACLVEFERALEGEEPDVVLVEGDSDPALALAIVAAKLELPLARVQPKGADDGPSAVGRVIALLADQAVGPGAVPTIPGS
jgi:hypothetical protein